MQDALRNYFSKHGFRVLLLTDFDRVLNRLKTSPPDCIVLFGDMGDRAVDVFRDAMGMTGCPAKLVLVLNRRQAELATNLDVNRSCGAVLPQPVQLRDLRQTVSALLGRPMDQNGD
jgi:serine/threonine-protein kinase